ncbi:MAG: prolyl oligopeptidase family serine peptidase [Bacteroidales bacterium]|nr:prolyl oligopeptidase family serine peptidase [Bacteroidales bacterium]
MKRTMTILAALWLAAAPSFAQRKVLHVSPESNPGGPILEMADLARVRSPYNTTTPLWHWNESGDPERGYRPSGAGTLWPLPVSDDPGIIYGTSVSRNEFGISGGVFPSNGGSLAAVYRKDERDVTSFPLLDINTRTGELVSVKYPMNGMASEHIALCVCDSLGSIIATIVPDDFTDEQYLTNITWSPDDRYIFIQVLDRSQHRMHLNMYRSCDGTFVRTLLTEENDAWVEPLDPLYFMKDSWNFLYRTDNRDGYRNLYLCDTLGTVRRLTAVDADVEYIDNDGRYVYYYSAEVSPVQRHLFRIDTRRRNARPQQLTSGRGMHTVSLSPDFKRFVDLWSDYDVPAVTQLRKIDGTLLETLDEAPDPLGSYAKCEVEFGTVPSADGQFENYYRLFKPLGFDPSKKYPLIVYVYGGPHSQMVTGAWQGNVRLWEMAMAQRGYVVYVQDNRGTQNRGAAFEKAINRQCGQAEMADQMSGIRTLLDEPWVDETRVGVHGWSYGGFMTISLMTNYPEVFKVGVAGGPVIDWKWYEVMYGERYMDTPESNPEGFAKTSLINMAPHLKGRLLICQGAIDQTVVWEHSLSFVQRCIEEDIQLDYFPYPRSEHNVSGVWRNHLNAKITDYFVEHL